MTSLNPALERISISATNAMMQRVGELKRQGVDLIGLSVGEPDFNTEPHIIDAAFRAMKNGQTRYTDVDGTLALKQAIAHKFKRENALDYDISEISVASGGKQILFNALVASLRPGDEAIIPTPCWVSYPDIIRFAGGVPIMLPTQAEKGYRLSPAALEKAITPKTRWLILNSPSNPTGAAYDTASLKALADVLAKHPQIMVLTDDIYEHIWFANTPFTTFAAAAPELKERTLTMNGVSKAYAMTGWRIGYAGGPKWLIDAMRKLQSQSTGNPSSISQAAALAALDGPQDFLAEQCEIYRDRRDLVVALLNDAPGLNCPVPDGAFYAFPDMRALIGKKSADGRIINDDLDFVNYLIDKARVACVPGSAFGHKDAFRISFADNIEILRKACQRIQQAAAALK